MDAFEGYLQNGDFENATLIARGRIYENAEDLVSHVGLARIAAAKGDPSEALQILKEQFARHPTSPLPPAYLAVIFDAQDQKDQAAQLAMRSIALGGKLAPVFCIAARFKRSGGQYDEALLLAQNAKQIAPQLSGAHLEIARAQNALGAHSKAEDAYIEVIKIAPQRAEAWIELIALEISAGTLDIAQQNLREALRIHPGHPQLLNLSKSFSSFEKRVPVASLDGLLKTLQRSILSFEYSKALDAFDALKAKAQPSDPRLLLAKGEIAIACGEGEIPPLVHALTQRARAAPNDWPCKTILGRLLLRESPLQNPAMGTAHLEEAWRISGENENAGLGLVEGLTALGKVSFAKALCEKLAEQETLIGKIAKGILDGSIEV